MTINNLEEFTKQLWDWGFLDNCFQGTKIKLSDIDGIVERKGKFLVVEAKSNGVPLKDGQRIMFENMVKLKVFTVIVVWEEPNIPKKIKVFSSNGIKELPDAKESDFQKIVSDWYIEANETREKEISSVPR